MLQTARDFCGDIFARFVIDESHNCWLERISACNQFAHGRIAPHQATLFGEIDLGIGRVIKTVRHQVKMRRKSRHRCLTQCLGLVGAPRFIHLEPKARKLAYKFTHHGDFAFIVYVSQKALLLFEPPQQNAGAPVHKSLGQRTMQRI